MKFKKNRRANDNRNLRFLEFSLKEKKKQKSTDNRKVRLFFSFIKPNRGKKIKLMKFY